MPANPALTPTEVTNLAKPQQTVYYGLSVEPNAVVGTAFVNSAPFVAPITQLSIGTTSPNWSNQRAGQLVRITDSTGAVLRGYYRNRKVGSTSVLYIDEVDFADPGLATILQRSSPIQNGDLVTIYERYPLFAVKPYQNSAGTIYQDYDIAVGSHNTNPDAASYNVTINGQPGDYVTMVPLGNKVTFAVTLTVTPWPNLTPSYTYSWTLPSAATSTSGLTTTTPAFTLPVGSYHIYCDVTDAATGYVFTVVRWIRIHDPSDPPLLCNITSDTRDRQKRTMGIRLVQGRISAIPFAAKCAIFTNGMGKNPLTGQPTYGNGQTWGGADVSTAAHTFVGFLYQQPFVHQPSWYESEADVVSPSAMLDMIYGYAVSLTDVGASSTWKLLPTALCTAQFVIWWILRWRVANLLNQFNFTPLTTSITTGHRNLFGIAGDTSILTQLQKAADMVDGNVGSRSDGEVICAYNPSLLVDRSGLVTRATLSDSLYGGGTGRGMSVQWVRRGPVGSVTWQGVIATGTQDVQYQATWPGSKASQGSRVQTATDKIFDSTANGAGRVGMAGIYANNEYPRITLDLPTNYDVFEPADMEQVTVTIPAAYSPTGNALTIPTCPLSITKRWLFGAAQLQMVTEGLTLGTPGQIAVVPTTQPGTVGQNSNPINNPVPNTPPSWGPPNSSTSTGSKGLILATQDGYFVRGSTWTDGSPTADSRTSVGTVIKLVADPWAYQRLIMFGSGGVLITDDATVLAPSWRYVSLDQPPITLAQAALVDTFSINSATNAIQSGTYNTTSGSTYRMVISGTVQYSYPANPDYKADAAYKTTTNFASYTANGNILLEDGSTYTPDSSAYQSSHSYSMTRIGTGSPFGGKFNDTAFGDNLGSFTVQVYAVPDAGTPISDLVGSINRQGWFAWLSKVTLGAVDYVYVNTTSNYFQSVGTSVPVAEYDAALTYGISMSSYNSGSTGYGYVTAGSTAASTAKVYSTSNWFASVSATAITLNTRGGAINVPYNAAGGPSNSAQPPQVAVVKGISTNLQGVSLAGSTVTIASGSSHYPYSQQGINSFTLDGTYLNLVMADGTVYVSSDGGGSWSAATTLPTASGYFLNGSPQNYQFLIGGGSSSLAISTDRAATWTNVWSSYNTFRSGAFGSGGTVIVTAMLDLALVYSKAVVQS